MNVKQFCDLIYKEDCPVKVTIGYIGDIIATLDIYNPLQMEAYGRFKVANFRAMDADHYEINLAYTPATPIVEN